MAICSCLCFVISLMEFCFVDWTLHFKRSLSDLCGRGGGSMRRPVDLKRYSEGRMKFDTAKPFPCALASLLW